MTTDPAEREAQIDRLCTEYLAAAEAGQAPDRTTWLAAHPEFAPEMAEFLDCMSEVRTRIAPLRAAAGVEETVAYVPGATEPEGDTPPAPTGYEILGKIKAGGMGVVYRARKLEVNRVVALKMIRAGEFSGDSAVQRFRLEAEAAAGFDHPNIVPVYEVGVTETGAPFFSMKLVSGRTLADWIAEGAAPGGFLHFAAGLRKGVGLLALVARAVHYAHQRGFLHRDLKPANVLLDSSEVPYVTDFGLAKRISAAGEEHTLTEAGGLVGTLGYMAPEQARGEKTLTTAADVYALGAILFHVLTARPLRPGRTWAEVSAHIGAEPPRPRSINRRIDRDLEAICLKCLEANPAARFGSAEALADDLERWLGARPTRTRPPGPTRRLAMWARRRPDIAALSAVTLLVFLAGVGLVAWKWRGEVAARREAQALASRSAAVVAQGLLEEGGEGDPEALGAAMLWWARSLRLAPPGREADRVSPRENLAALAGRLHTLREVWERPGTPARMALSPDGRRSAVVEHDAVQVMDAHTGEAAGAPLAHPGVSLAAFSPDGGTLATAGGGVVRVWNPADSRLVREWPFADPVRLLAVNPRGDRVAVVAPGGRVVRLFGAGAAMGLEHPQPVSALAFDSTGARLATGCEDQKARAWDPGSGALDAELAGHDDAVRAVAFHPDPKTHHLLTGCDDHLARVFDINAKAEVLRMQHQDYVRAVAFAPDGRFVVTGGSDSAAQVWEADSGRRVGQPLPHRGAVAAVGFASGGSEVVVWGSEDAGAVVGRVWGVSLAARVERSATAGGAVYALSELPGRTFLVGTQREAGLLNADAPAGVSRTLQVPKGDEVWATAVRPGGEWIALGGKAEDGRGWLALTRPDGRDFRRLALPRPARSLSFSPAGTPLLAGTADAEAGGVREYDTSDPLAPVLVRENALGPAWAVAFSHDGTRYATSAGYGEVRVWNASTSQPEGMPLGHPWRAVAIGFSRDGRRLVSASTDRRVRVWDTSNGVLVSESAAHRGAVWAVGVSPDGRLFATGGRDGCVRLWNAETGAPLGTPLRHPGPVWGVTFNRDGTELWSGGEGKRDAGAVRRWLAPVTSLKVPDAHAEAWAETATGSRLDGDRVRVLSPAEWRERRDRLTAAGVSW